jgi:hypothetical protein
MRTRLSRRQLSTLSFICITLLTQVAILNVAPSFGDPPPLAITSVSESKVLGGGLLTIAVTGLQPGGTIMVVFSKYGAGKNPISLSVPGLSTDQANVQVSAPPYLSGPVEIQVQEQTDSAQLSSMS